MRKLLQDIVYICIFGLILIGMRSIVQIIIGYDIIEMIIGVIIVFIIGVVWMHLGNHTQKKSKK